MVIARMRRFPYWFPALAALIVVGDLAFLRFFSLSEEDPALIYAVMLDFMIVLPFLYWLLVLRAKGKPATKARAFPLLGALAVWLIVPASQRHIVWNAAWPVEALIIAAEVVFIGYEIRIMYRLIKRYRHVAREEADPAEALRATVHGGVGQGKLASLLLHDASLVYYLLFSWKKSSRAIPCDTPAFTYHRQTNQVLYAVILTKIILFEGIAAHLLLQQWSHWAAWIATIADLWLLALVWGDCRASVLQPVTVKGDTLRLRYGLRLQADIPLANIAHVSSASEFNLDARERKNAATSLITPNVRIELKRPAQVNGLLFLPREVTVLYIALDEPGAFVQAIGHRLAAS